MLNKTLATYISNIHNILVSHSKILILILRVLVLNTKVALLRNSVISIMYNNFLITLRFKNTRGV